MRRETVADETPVAARLVAACAERGWTIATAESLTAGSCAATIADVAGASAVLRGGLITYDVELKASLAGLDARALEREGVVSRWTALHLARGAATVCGADVGLGLTGVAGPAAHGGAVPGTVWGAVWTRAGSTDGSTDAAVDAVVNAVVDGQRAAARRWVFGGLGRAEVRRAAVVAVLTLAEQVVLGGMRVPTRALLRERPDDPGMVSP